jgi:hypothetical protein
VTACITASWLRLCSEDETRRAGPRRIISVSLETMTDMSRATLVLRDWLPASKDAQLWLGVALAGITVVPVPAGAA